MRSSKIKASESNSGFFSRNTNSRSRRFTLDLALFNSKKFSRFILWFRNGKSSFSAFDKFIWDIQRCFRICIFFSPMRGCSFEFLLVFPKLPLHKLSRVVVDKTRQRIQFVAFRKCQQVFKSSENIIDCNWDHPFTEQRFKLHFARGRTNIRMPDFGFESEFGRHPWVYFWKPYKDCVDTVFINWVAWTLNFHGPMVHIVVDFRGWVSNLFILHCFRERHGRV